MAEREERLAIVDADPATSVREIKNIQMQNIEGKSQEYLN